MFKLFFRFLSRCLYLCVTTDYLPFATSGTANVDTQANYNNSTYQQNGFTNGIAQPFQANKVWRQSSMVAAAWATIAMQLLNQNVPDDGNLTNLIAQLKACIKFAGLALQVVTFSANPTFDASQALDFEMTLTGNVTGSSLINLTAGQELTFIIHQDGTGSRTFVPPSNLPLATIDPGANKTTVQQFKVSSSLALYPITAPTVT